MSFRELLGQRKVMQIRQGETQSHQGAITHEVCCSLDQCTPGPYIMLIQLVRYSTHIQVQGLEKILSIHLVRTISLHIAVMGL